MKYTVQSAKYILKNFLYIFPLAILPAFLLSLSTDEVAITKVLTETFTGSIEAWTFSELFHAISILSFGNWQAVVFGLLGIIAMVPCVALLMAFLEKHFRIGKRTFNGLWSKLNDNFISTCVYALLFVALYEIWALLTAAVVFILSMIPVAWLAYVLSIAAYIAMHVLLLYLVGFIYLWLPCLQITGFRAIEALHYSQQLVTPVKWKILGGQILFLLFAEALIGVCAVFLPGWVAFTLITTALYSILLMFFFVRMQIAYFDRDQIERADLKWY